jgi:hypothetical protein
MEDIQLLFNTIIEELYILKQQEQQLFEELYNDLDEEVTYSSTSSSNS